MATFLPQILALSAAVLVGVFYRGRVVSRFRRLENGLREKLRRPLVGWLLAALLSLLLNWQLVSRHGIPVPWVQDEFSYLLAADTFAHGRLTNPTHPLWRFFETFHVLQQPSYMSKYPPGHGLMMALGEGIAGEPLLGVWIEAALLCVCAGWMLFGFLPATASVAGAVAVALNGLVLQWSAHYWGGSLACAGGCLVLGAWVRLDRGQSWRPGVVLGLGLFTLAITRPYEGLCFSIPLLFWTVLRPRAGVIATAAILLIGGCWLMYDNDRVTGHPLQLPYTLYEQQYALAPTFLWQPARPDHPFDRPVMRDYARQVELPHYQAQRSFAGFATQAWEKLAYEIVALRLVWLLTLILPWLPAVVAEDRRLRLPAVALLGVVIATLGSNWTRPQYIAPALPVLLLIGVAAVWRVMRSYPVAGRAILVGTFVGLIAEAIAFGAAQQPTSARQRLRQLLQSGDGSGARCLVFVRYAPGHRLDDEWVYNSADIDQQPIVWAADRGASEDQQAMRYYADRQAWLCTVDANAAHYERITPAPTTSVTPP